MLRAITVLALALCVASCHKITKDVDWPDVACPPGTVTASTFLKVIELRATLGAGSLKDQILEAVEQCRHHPAGDLEEHCGHLVAATNAARQKKWNDCLEALKHNPTDVPWVQYQAKDYYIVVDGERVKCTANPNWLNHICGTMPAGAYLDDLELFANQPPPIGPQDPAMRDRILSEINECRCHKKDENDDQGQNGSGDKFYHSSNEHCALLLSAYQKAIFHRQWQACDDELDHQVGAKE